MWSTDFCSPPEELHVRQHSQQNTLHLAACCQYKKRAPAPYFPGLTALSTSHNRANHYYYHHMTGFELVNGGSHAATHPMILALGVGVY